MISPLFLGAAIAVTFYMAWNIGANDVANAMGTSVGSGALTLRRAILVAAVFEFAGAFLVGGHVTQTIRAGIIDTAAFGEAPRYLAYGMLGALLSASTWLLAASHLGLPVSTTHAIVGSVAGFGLIAGGFSVVRWSKLALIVMSWVTSPFLGGLLAFLIFTYIRRTIFASERPAERASGRAPAIVSVLFVVLTLSFIYKGLKRLHLDFSLIHAVPLALAVGIVAGLITLAVVRRHPSVDPGLEAQYGYVERIFGVLQIFTACYVAFAHGANDVANAIGPFAAIVALAQEGVVRAEVPVPLWALLLGGSGIIVGLATFGYRVMATIGRQITELTPSRGFAAEFSAATVILLASRMGIPVSTTHTLVGAVIGVGLARGMAALNLQVVRRIGASWLLEVPVVATLSILFFEVLRRTLG